MHENKTPRRGVKTIIKLVWKRWKLYNKHRVRGKFRLVQGVNRCRTNRAESVFVAV